jgi:hypothetical protein
MTARELEAAKKYSKEYLGKGFIRPRSSSAAALVLLERKPGRALRVCIDYRALNVITLKNPIPQIQETLDRPTTMQCTRNISVIFTNPSGSIWMSFALPIWTISWSSVIRKRGIQHRCSRSFNDCENKACSREREQWQY